MGIPPVVDGMDQAGGADGMAMTVGVVVAGTMVAVGVEAASMDGMID
jgi:hypothetical protein